VLLRGLEVLLAWTMAYFTADCLAIGVQCEEEEAF
jgi:hypothetical protein